MAPYSLNQIAALQENEDFMLRMQFAAAGAARAILVDAESTDAELKVAGKISRSPRDGAGWLFWSVVTTPAVLAKFLDDPTTLTDADLATAAAAVAPGLVKAAILTGGEVR